MTRRGPVRRLLASLAAGATVLILSSAAPSNADQARFVCPESALVWTDGVWTVVERPRGVGALHGAAVDVDQPDTIYVTDGRRVARSTSGGCSWQIVLDLAFRGGPGDALRAAEITSIVVPATGSGRVYATVANTGPLNESVIAPVLASFDRGRTWHTARGLPAIRPSRLRASPADPDVMYLSMHTGELGNATVPLNSVPVRDIWSFYASTDGGRSWRLRSTGQQRATFVPDPIDSGVVWSLGSETSAVDGPYRSDDGGVTWTPTAAQPTNDLDRADLDVFRTAGRSAQIVIAQGGSDPTEPAQTSVHRSSDGGATFSESPTTGLAGAVRSVAFGRTENDVVLSLDSGVYRSVAPADAWLDVDSLNLAPLTDAARIQGEPGWWFWRSELIALYREVAPLPPAPDKPAVQPIQVGCLPNRGFSPALRPRAPDASLEALDDPLELEPSVPARTHFRLSLPAVPTPLDTYFLLDTSTSMKTAIDGVVCGLEQLVDDLTRAGVDARFGLGEFQDAARMRYERVLDIAPPGVKLRDALRSRTLRGGKEPHRGALYQTATGAGLRDLAGRELIRAGQGATYRPNALRVVLLVTDEPYETTTTYEPTVLQVVDALRRRDIHHIGIHVRSEDVDARVRSEDVAVEGTAEDELTRRQLEEFSRRTETFAPEGGVDCDGDGSVDLEPGAPLVCTVARKGITANLAQTLTAVLFAVRDDGIATLRPVRAEGMDVDALSRRHIDVHDAHTGRGALTLAANITCADKHAGTRHTLLMAADVSGIEVARTPFRVACGAPPTAADPYRPPLAAAAPPAGAPVAMPAAEPSLSGSVSGATVANPGSAPGVTVTGQMPGTSAVAVAPEERESGVQPISHNFTDAMATVRVLGAGVLLGSFVAIERRRRSDRRAFATVRRRR